MVSGLRVLKHHADPKPHDRDKQSMRPRTHSTCTFEPCDGKHFAKGYCKRHWAQWKKTGDPTIRRPNQWGTPEERFWRLTGKRSDSECWIWRGRLDKDGYGSLRIKFELSPVRAHRFSYQLHYGLIPEGCLIRHLCNNPSCVNPKHLAHGTQTDNMRDRTEAGHAPIGESHPMVKYPDSVVIAVRAAVGKRKDIAQRFGMSESQVGNIRSGAQRKVVHVAATAE
jgi:hypothetical protein